MFMHLFNKHFLNVASIPSAVLSTVETQAAPVFKMHDLLLSGNHQDSTERVRGCVTLGRETG